MPQKPTPAAPRRGYADAWMGIDVGTQGVRAIVVDDDGTPLGSGSAPLTGRRADDRHEQDPEHWWDATCVAARQAAAALRGRRLGGVAVDATSGTIVVHDRDGRARGPGLMYDDSRAVAQAARAQEAGRAQWWALGYRVQPTWALPKVVWLREHGHLADGDRVAHQADHVGARLAGHPVATDTASALKTGYDTAVMRWPVEVLAALGVAAEHLPEVVLPGTTVAQVGRAAAEATGIPAGTPVVAGTTDGCAAQIATGALAPGTWSSALGTTLVVKGASAELLRDPAGAVYCHRHPDGGWLPGGASGTGAGVLARDFAGHDLDALTAVMRARGTVPSGVSYPLAGRGERFPFVAPDAHGFTEDTTGDEVERFAGVLHGVAFLERLAYEVLAGLGADTSGPVALTGGAARNGYWNQLRADVLGRPAQLPAHADAAFGAAVLAAAPPGRLGATAAAMVRIVATLEPDAQRGAALAEPYARFRTALEDRGWLPRDVPAGADGPPRPGPAPVAQGASG